MSTFQRGEWVQIVGQAVDDPPIFQLRSSAEIAEVVERNGGAHYYVRVGDLIPDREFGPFPETRFRAFPGRSR